MGKLLRSHHISSVYCHHGHHRTDRFLVSELSVPDGTVKSQINALYIERIYYPLDVSSMKYCCLRVFRKEYFRLVIWANCIKANFTELFLDFAYMHGISTSIHRITAWVSRTDWKSRITHERLTFFSGCIPTPQAKMNLIFMLVLLHKQSFTWSSITK